MKPEMLVLPGQLAFFFLLSIVPTITLIGYGAGFLNLSTDVIYNFLTEAFNENIAGFLMVNPTNALGLEYIITLLVGYYFASTALNYIENSKDFIGQAVNRIKYERPGKYIFIVFLLVVTWLPAIIGQIFCILFNKNVRELEGAFNKVCAYAEVTACELDLNLAKSVLKCANDEKDISFDKIARVTAQYYDVDVNDIKGTAKNAKVSNARHMAIYLARELTSKSFVSIAEFYNKKHTTIMFAHEKIKKEIASNNDLERIVREIKQALNNELEKYELLLEELNIH